MIVDLLAKRHGIFVLRWRGVERVGHAVLLALAEVVNQEVSCDGGYPGHQRASLYIVRRKRPIHLNENLLGEVLSIVARARKSIANVVDASMIALHDFLPSSCVACDTAAYQHGGDLRVFQPCTPGTPGFATWSRRVKRT